MERTDIAPHIRQFIRQELAPDSSDFDLDEDVSLLHVHSEAASTDTSDELPSSSGSADTAGR